MANQTIWAAYPTAAAVVVLFGLFAGIYTYFRHKKVGKDTTEFFLTARRSVVRPRPHSLFLMLLACVPAIPQAGLECTFRTVQNSSCA